MQGSNIPLGETSQLCIWGDLGEPRFLPVQPEWQLSSSALQSLCALPGCWALDGAEGLEGNVELGLLPAQVGFG